VQKVMSLDGYAEEGKISRRSLSAVPDLRKEIVDLQVSTLLGRSTEADQYRLDCKILVEGEVEKLVKIIEQSMKKLRTKEIPMVKMPREKSRNGLRRSIHIYFEDLTPEFRDRITLRGEGGGCDTPP
jgi:hypothetical protein